MKSFPPATIRPLASRAHRAPASGAPGGMDLVYELAPLAYINLDREGRLLDFNVAAARLLGVSREADLHRPLSDFILARHRKRLARYLHEALASNGATGGIKSSAVRTRMTLRGGMAVEITTRPAAESHFYRTVLLPIAEDGRPPWPMEDAKFRALVENSSEGICIGAPDGTVFYTTPSVQRVLGYAAASWYGRNAIEVIHPAQAEAVLVCLRRLAARPTGSVERMVVQVRHADGSWRWVDTVFTNLIGQPAIGGIVCNYRDITESRHAEEELRVSEMLYRHLAESMPQMISIRDETGRVEYCNTHWREYRGVIASGSIAHDWREGIPEEDLPGLQKANWMNGILQPWEAECRIRRGGDGALRWHHVRIVPLPRQPGGPLRILVIAADIHERRTAEQERERLLAQLERERSEMAVQYALVRVLAEAVSLEDAAPRLLAACCDQLGWQAGVLWRVTPGRSPRLALVHMRQPPGVAAARLPIQADLQPLRKGQGLAGRVWRDKLPLSAGDLASGRGETLHRAAARVGLRRAFAFPILLAGEAHGVVELFRRDPVQPGERLLDTVASVGIQIGLFLQRTQALERLSQGEEALIQVNNALEKRVCERTAELHEANDELSSEIAERTRLEREIIRISEREQRRIGQDLHDGLCQELAAIAFMTRALANRLDKSDLPEAPRINEISRLLNDSITRCRDISRGLHPVEMDADGLMVALEDLARRTSQTIACAFECDEPILVPESDIALNLYRIAQEAVINALKYSGASRVVISLRRDAGAVRLAIRDDGGGISPRARRAAGERDGMGLHIMRYRARTMGATLRILDHKPHGAEVVCTTPLK